MGLTNSGYSIVCQQQSDPRTFALSASFAALILTILYYEPLS